MDYDCVLGQLHVLVLNFQHCKFIRELIIIKTLMVFFRLLAVYVMCINKCYKLYITGPSEEKWPKSDQVFSLDFFKIPL